MLFVRDAICVQINSVKYLQKSWVFMLHFTFNQKRARNN